MKPKIIILLFLNLFCYSSYGQTKENNQVYEIISVVIENINPAIPIVDTLRPTSIPDKFLRKQIEEKVSLNRKQKRILKVGEEIKTGILIDRNELSKLKFYANDSINNFFQKT
jgi:hypothetical protein